jgi:hypothetical protein
VAYSCPALMEARAGLPAAEEDCGTPSSSVLSWVRDRRTEPLERLERRQLHALEDVKCVSGITMPSFMPFFNEYWPFIAAGVICYLGAKFLYHSALSWDPNPGAAQSYETSDKGTRMLIQNLVYGFITFVISAAIHMRISPFPMSMQEILK